MAKKNKVKSDSSLTGIGDNIFVALTQREIVNLLDALFEILSPDIRDKALDHLHPDTRQIVQHILHPSEADGDREITKTKLASVAKLEQTWSELWDKWYGIVEAAAQEEGEYMAQEVHWEPPYFDDTSFVDDLEKVAAKMRPLLQRAFEGRFLPDTGFARALLGAEEEVSSAMPEWIVIDDGFYLEENLTTCLLEWEWLTAMDEEGDAFAFAQSILDWENQFSLVTLKEDTLVNFFTQLSESDQKTVFEGLRGSKETSLWKKLLKNAHSHWHAVYMYYVDQYAPEQYLDNLRVTIPQQWQNGLPVIEDLLAKKDYGESLKVIKKTLDSMRRFEQGEKSWTPETSLLFAIVGEFYYNHGDLGSYKNLLDYYQQTAKGLEQPQRVSALEIQLIAFDHFFDWQTMFKAFEEVSVPNAKPRDLV